MSEEKETNPVEHAASEEAEESTEAGSGTEEEVLEPQPEEPQPTCCPDAQPKSVKPCTLCGKTTCNKCRGMVNGKLACQDCKSKILEELEQEKANTGNLMVATAFGILARRQAMVEGRFK